jgi:paraquat-inducible protein B
MSIRANPRAIGLFLIGGLALAVGGTAVLASTAWFEKRTTFISFFQESVNGLEVGAPVKFQGVPVGSVTGILIQIDQTTRRSRCRSSTRSTDAAHDADRHVREPRRPAVLRQQITGWAARADADGEHRHRTALHRAELQARAQRRRSWRRGCGAWPEIPTRRR